MEKEENSFSSSTRIRKLLTTLTIVFFLLSFTFYLVKLPVNIASWFVTFEVELPEYIPLDIETKYAKVVGFNKLKIVFENPNEKLTVLITNDIGWNNVSNWDEEVKLTDGVLAYYNRNDVNNIQMISWRKDRVEYAIDYEGKGSIDKHKLIKIASSTK